MPRHGVNFVKNDDPSFIKKFKERIGHKEGPDVDSKRGTPDFEDDGEDEMPEKEDEKPIVVVIEKGDLTAEEVDKEEKLINEGPARLDEKITFKKPIKRSQGTSESTTDYSNSVKKVKKSKKKTETFSKSTKNSSLLSFDDEAEEGE